MCILSVQVARSPPFHKHFLCSQFQIDTLDDSTGHPMIASLIERVKI